MINKKGQVGKIMTALPVFVLVLIMVGAFIAFSAILPNKSTGFKEKAQSIQDSNMFFSTIKTTYDKKVVEMRVIDALSKGLNPDMKYTYDIFFGDLRQWVIENKACAVLFYPNLKEVVRVGWRYTPQYEYEGVHAAVISKDESNGAYRQFSNTASFSLKGANGLDIIVNYYAGRCLE